MLPCFWYSGPYAYTTATARTAPTKNVFLWEVIVFSLQMSLAVYLLSHYLSTKWGEVRGRLFEGGRLFQILSDRRIRLFEGALIRGFTVITD